MKDRVNVASMGSLRKSRRLRKTSCMKKGHVDNLQKEQEHVREVAVTPSKHKSTIQGCRASNGEPLGVIGRAGTSGKMPREEKPSNNHVTAQDFTFFPSARLEVCVAQPWLLL